MIITSCKNTFVIEFIEKIEIPLTLGSNQRLYVVIFLFSVERGQFHSNFAAVKLFCVKKGLFYYLLNLVEPIS